MSGKKKIRLLQRKPESTGSPTSEMERLHPQTSQRALFCCRVEMTLHATRPCRSQLPTTDHSSFGDSMQQNTQYCQRSLVVCIASQPALLNQSATSHQSVTPSPTSALVCLPRRSKQLSLCDGAFGMACWAAAEDIFFVCVADAEQDWQSDIFFNKMIVKENS